MNVWLHQDLVHGCGMESDGYDINGFHSCRKPVVAVGFMADSYIGVCNEHSVEIALTGRLIPIKDLLNGIFEYPIQY